MILELMWLNFMPIQGSNYIICEWFHMSNVNMHICHLDFCHRAHSSSFFRTFKPLGLVIFITVFLFYKIILLSSSSSESDVTSVNFARSK